MEFRWKTLLLLSLLLPAIVLCEDAVNANLAADLQEAVETQQAGEEVPEPVKAKIIKEAPIGVLPSGTGDVATTGACAGDVENFCATVKPGEGRLAICLTKQQDEEAKGNIEGKTLTDDCKGELAAFKIELGESINKNLALAKACKEDATKLCADQDPTDPVAVLACLRDLKDSLSATCSAEIFNTQLEAAKDYRTDADLHAACEPDAKQLCANVNPGEGRIQDCLRDKAVSVSWECQEELFRQEVENADDLRLSQRLFKKCMGDKKKFCADIKFGGARVKDCLEARREEVGFSAECKEELEAMMEKRAADFRLDSTLREVCADDIEAVCGYERDSLDTVEGFDARVIQCLQDYRDELAGPECRKQVHVLTQRASQDIRFDEPLADACYEDRARLCDGVQPGSARVIRCLQDAREELSYECRATLFDAEVRMAEDIDFKYPMKRACTSEIQAFCSGIQHGEARVIRCLQDHIEESDFSSECKEEVARDQIRSNQDYRLNFRLNTACEADIDTLCAEECSPFLGSACGGRVLRCLTEKQDAIKSKECADEGAIKSKECADEVFYFEKMEVNDFRNDVLLAEACRTDVDKYCKHIEPGEGRVHQCLRDNFQKLQDGCRKEELKLNIIQSRDVRLRPKLNKACSDEITVFCQGIQPGKGRVFQCLQQSLAQPDFGQACRAQVEERGQRMQEDYRLDYGVAEACEPDVVTYCSAEKGLAHGNAEVLKCLVKAYSKLADTCQREMSRAVRMALWEYKKGAALTGVCDADVAEIPSCQTAVANPKNRGIWSIGAVGRCLSRQLAENKALTLDCRSLVIVAAPKDAQAMFDSSMSAAAIAQRVQELQAAAGIKAQLVNPAGRGAGIITLTGWVALAALVSLVVVVVGAIVFAYRKFAGLDKPYTIVTKQGDV
ncbi:probable Golgi apparatus protein 1 [Coccomyxa sp. Obi]|nr:probable Golgi apparatus protein 1 [Coccomyxa sp. Obi]